MTKPIPRHDPDYYSVRSEAVYNFYSVDNSSFALK